MKLIIHSQERKEYVALPPREKDDWPRELRERLGSQESMGDRELLGAAAPEFADESSREPLREPSQGRVEETPQDFFQTALENGNDEVLTDDEQAASWKHSRWTWTLLLGAIVVLGAMWFLASRADRGLRLSSIRVEGASLLTSEEVLKLAHIDRSAPFYEINLKEIEHRLLTHSLIRSASVTRELDPARLVISVQEREPVAILRSDSAKGVPNGETYLIDKDGLLLRPKLIAGLRDPNRLLQVPLLSGVTANDTPAYRAMAKMVTFIASLDSGALRGAIGELHRAPTGAFVLYTTETQTPIFLGSPFDREFHTALEDQRDSLSEKNEVPLFYRQLNLVAALWKARIQNEVRAGHALYLDARFEGQVILKQRVSNGNLLARAAREPVSQDPLISAHYGTNANQRTIQ
ncbi:MAG TPA: FtsQ-type POTRA domain-containing protein [Candidatus Kapabacteria bacterium]|jgi:cell division septal protein FtsQ